MIRSTNDDCVSVFEVCANMFKQLQTPLGVQLRRVGRRSVRRPML